MSSQLNPIMSDIAGFRLPQQTTEQSRLAGMYDVFSQGYPPNVSGSTPTINWPPNMWLLVVDPTDLGIVNEPLKSAFENTSSYFVQELVVRRETQTKNPAIRLSDLIVHDIDELMAGKEDEEKPTEFAYKYARRVVESAYGRAKFSGSATNVVPKPVATTDDVGGIRLLWNLGVRNVRLNFGAAQDRQSYLYYEAGQEHGVEPLDEDHLAARLAWLTSR